MLNNNLLIQGENLQALQRLAKNYANKIDLIYIDPPFNSNQIFYCSSQKNNSISKCGNGQIAYIDKFTLREFLEFLKERLVLLRELLSEQGSLYLHIDDKMSHYVKIVMDEIFGIQNFKNDITRIKCNPKNFERSAYGNEKDVILFYSKNSKKNIWNEIRLPLNEQELENSFKKIDKNGRRYNTVPCHAPGETQNGETAKEWMGLKPPLGRHWRYSPVELTKLQDQGLIEWSKTGVPRIIKYADEHIGKKVQDVWIYKDPQNPRYPTQKNLDMLKFIVSQSSNTSSIVLDCFAGSGTTLEATTALNRKWIGIDNSKIAIDIIKQMLLKQNIDYEFMDYSSPEDNSKIAVYASLKQLEMELN